MELSKPLQGDVPRDVLDCRVENHAHIYAKFPSGLWLVVAVPNGAELKHATAALKASDGDALEAALDGSGSDSALKLFRDCVMLFPIEADGLVPPMTLEEAQGICIKAAPPEEPETGPDEEPEEPDEAPGEAELTEGGPEEPTEEPEKKSKSKKTSKK